MPREREPAVDTGRATGANFANVQEAIDLGLRFIRVTDDTTEPAVLTFPSGESMMIYVDPGVTYTMAAGTMDLSNRSLTLTGNASAASSHFVVNTQFECDTTTTLHFSNCHVTNANNGPINSTTTDVFYNHFACTQRCLWGC